MKKGKEEERNRAHARTDTCEGEDGRGARVAIGVATTYNVPD